MAKSINILHPDELLQNYSEYTKYRYNGTDWVKKDSIIIDRYIDVSINDITPSGTSVDNYIEISKTYYNVLLQSEGLKESVWYKQYISVISNSSTFTFPDNVNPAFTILPSVGTNSNEHSITQQFMANLNKSYIFSMFVKDVPESQNHKVALIVKDVRYNVLLSAEINLAGSYQWTTLDSNTARAPLTIKFLDGSTFATRSDVDTFFSNYSAYLLRIKKDDKFYYRPFIKFKLKNITNFRVGMIVLNSNGDYSYPIPDESPVFYMSGAQLEEYISSTPDNPTNYMITYKSPVKNIIQKELYSFDGNGNVILLNNVINYLNDTKEANVKIVIEPGRHSVVSCICTGVPGTVINDINSNKPALAKSTRGDIFECTTRGTIPQSGSIALTFRSVEMDAIPVAANTITRIASSVPGWHSVNNESAGIEGEPEIANIYTKMISSKPDILTPKNGDLAVLQSVIAFGTIASDINNKKYSTWGARKIYAVGDRVSYLANLYECVTAHTSSTSFSSDISKWKLILDSVGLGVITQKSGESNAAYEQRIRDMENNPDIPYGSIYYNCREKVYKIKTSTENGDLWLVLDYQSSETKNNAIVQSLLFNQGVFETWNQQSLKAPEYVLGLNTGGNFNFVKLSQISKQL